MTIAFLICSGLLPVVPLIGVEIFKRKNDTLRRNVCWGLFVLQLLLSLLYALTWLRTH